MSCEVGKDCSFCQLRKELEPKRYWCRAYESEIGFVLNRTAYWGMCLKFKESGRQ